MNSMRSSVVVDGVTLTREQVEKAMQELNTPVEPSRPKAGDVTIYSGHVWVWADVAMLRQRLTHCTHDTISVEIGDRAAVSVLFRPPHETIIPNAAQVLLCSVK